MELRQLKTLVNIIDYGGFAAAGEAIGLTQSAISLQVKALEDALGAALFDRSKRPPMPNAKAITLVRKSREILRMCAELEDFSEVQLAGSMQLGAVPTVLPSLLPKALKLLQRSHPGLFINIHSGLSDELVRSVHRGILDAAIVSEPAELSIGLSWHPFVCEKLVLIAPEEFVDDDPIKLLGNYPFIRFKRRSYAGELIHSELKELSVKVKTIIETDNLESVWGMVSCGLGVSVVPLQEVISQRPEKLKVIPLRKKPTELITGLVLRTSDPKSHLVTALYSALEVMAKDGYDK